MMHTHVEVCLSTMITRAPLIGSFLSAGSGGRRSCRVDVELPKDPHDRGRGKGLGVPWGSWFPVSPWFCKWGIQLHQMSRSGSVLITRQLTFGWPELTHWFETGTCNGGRPIRESAAFSQAMLPAIPSMICLIDDGWWMIHTDRLFGWLAENQLIVHYWFFLYIQYLVSWGAFNHDLFGGGSFGLLELFTSHTEMFKH